jgi:hypothetical protein
MEENRTGRDKTYSAMHVREVADISYRQLNDWESKGVIDSQREGKPGWRRFEPREVFTLMVISELRKQFGVPLESLRWIRSFMLQEGADHFRAAAELIQVLGVPVLIMTDLKRTLVLDTVLEFIDLMQLNYFGGDEPGGYIFLKVNPLVNRLLACTKPPMKLESHGLGYKIRAEGKPKNMEEFKVLQLLRNKTYSKLEVKLEDGSILSAAAEQELSNPDPAELKEILAEAKYQTVSVTQMDGKVVRICRKLPIKFENSVGQLKRREKPELEKGNGKKK